MKTSRQRIYEYICAQRAVTIGELSAALRSSEANIRHHLGILQEQKLVAVIGERPVGGKGRPAQIFGPSAQSLGDNLDLLADVLLDEIEAELPEEARQRLLERAAGRLGQAVQAGQLLEPASLRLIQAVQRLNQRHYQARWEARPDGPRIILGHCPFAAVIDRHPWLCAVDARLLEQLQGRPARQIERLAPDGQGARQCVFRLE